MSVRELYGWTPRTFTRHTDADGRVSESVSWTESRWPVEEVSLLLASRRRNVGPHGVPMDQALDPANRGKFIVEATTDFAAEAVATTRKKYETDYAHQDLSSLMWSARLAPPPDPVDNKGD